MNITEPLPKFIELEYHDEIWQQPMDYEHIPFRCKRCHEYEHIYKECPLNRTEEVADKQEEERASAEDLGREKEGFKEVHNKRKLGRSIPQRNIHKENISLKTQNEFTALQEEEVEMEKETSDEEMMETLKDTGKQVSGQMVPEEGEP